MGVWDRLSGWADRQSSPNTPRPVETSRSVSAANDPQLERAMRPLAFTVDIAAEIEQAWAGAGVGAPKVSRDMALGVPAVKRVRDLIAATIGGLEFFELTDPGNKPMRSELLRQPEINKAPSITFTWLAEDLLFEEVAWWRVTEVGAGANGDWPQKIKRIPPNMVQEKEDGTVWAFDDDLKRWRRMSDEEIIRFESPCPGLLKYGARTIRNAHAIDEAVSRNVRNPVPMGYLSPRENPSEGEPEDPPNTKVIVDDWLDAVQRHAFPYLNGAVQFNKVQWTPAELALNEAKDANILDVARLGGVDPEELGVSTTSRTYATSETRRLDLLDFTIKAYITAIQGRLSMDDVTQFGRKVRARYEGFLRSDTKTRMETYEIGRRVGVYNSKRIADIEEIPSAEPETQDDGERQAGLMQKSYLAVGTSMKWEEVRAWLLDNGIPLDPNAPPPQAAPAPQPSTQEVQSMYTPGRAVGFSAPVTDHVQFDISPAVFPQAGPEFKVEREKRKITGLAIPWNSIAYADGRRWKFLPGSLHWSEDSRVKLDMDHLHGTEFGKGESFTNNPDLGLVAKFSVARGPRGDEALGLAEDGVYDGLSVWVTFDSEGDGWTDDYDNDLAIVHSATLRKVALTAIPAFDNARVLSVAASQKGNRMFCQTCGQQAHAPGVTCPQASGGVALATAPAPPPAPPVAPQPFDPVAFTNAFTAGFGPEMAKQIAEAFKPVIDSLPQPQGRPVVPAGRATVTREAPVYTMNGRGPSFVKDAWKSRTEGDHEAKERLAKFQQQTAETANAAMQEDPVAFAVNTGNASGLIPPGFRPDLYVTQLIKGRPMVNGISRGTISDATPFNIPAYVSSTNEAADHVEGVNPTQGTLVVGTVTVAPGAISGTYQITREMADSANPAVDAIATQAMAEKYSQLTEGKVYAELNGTTGVGGTITTGFVPSGAQAYAVTGSAGGVAAGGDELLAQVRQATAVYPFRRFAGLDWSFMSMEATQAFAGATDSTGRPLLPYVGPMNAVGTSRPNQAGYLVDGLVYEPAWSMTGNTSTDADIIAGAKPDVWCWESPTLMFRFEEKSGPANIDLALFGYFACRVLRPIGLVGIRYTVTP